MLFKFTIAGFLFKMGCILIYNISDRNYSCHTKEFGCISDELDGNDRKCVSGYTIFSSFILYLILVQHEMSMKFRDNMDGHPKAIK